ncbi:MULTISPECIES: hypothetical protein [Microvirga]|uniref:hypothetical protein n=1 Tax=Microvirga TaxID=186650 RepID=UPI001B39944D|nr:MULTISPECIES: hypothetical protein [unclassified Microvirga]MBQ0819160.1 hypothetical protein [Microvirga sp. HBU67558]
MAELAVLTSPANDLASPKAASLGRDVVLLTWDVPHVERGSSSSLKSGGDDIWPSASLRLSLPDGGSRLFWIFQRPADERASPDLHLEAHGSEASLNIDHDAALASADVENLIDGIDSHGRVALVSALFNVWSTMFRLRRDKTFIDLLTELLSRMAPT